MKQIVIAMFVTAVFAGCHSKKSDTTPANGSASTAGSGAMGGASYGGAAGSAAPAPAAPAGGGY